MTKAKSEIKLPHVPSGLIDLALRDMRVVEKMPGYSIDMTVFHYTTREGCRVCAVGAVMVNTFGLQRTGSMEGGFVDEHNAAAFRAIDCFRVGRAENAFYHLKLPEMEGKKFNRKITPYAMNKNAFYRAMRKLSSDLQKAGY